MKKLWILLIIMIALIFTACNMNGPEPNGKTGSGSSSNTETSDDSTSGDDVEPEAKAWKGDWLGTYTQEMEGVTANLSSDLKLNDDSYSMAVMMEIPDMLPKQLYREEKGSVSVSGSTIKMKTSHHKTRNEDGDYPADWMVTTGDAAKERTGTWSITDGKLTITLDGETRTLIRKN